MKYLIIPQAAQTLRCENMKMACNECDPKQRENLYLKYPLHEFLRSNYLHTQLIRITKRV
jgi:hypothetical protein